MKVLEVFDQWAVAYIIAHGVKLVKLNPTGRFTGYVFDDTGEQATKALHDWRRGEAVVRAREYAEAYREAKRLAFSVTA